MCGTRERYGVWLTGLHHDVHQRSHFISQYHIAGNFRGRDDKFHYFRGPVSVTKIKAHKKYLANINEPDRQACLHTTTIAKQSGMGYFANLVTTQVF